MIYVLYSYSTRVRHWCNVQRVRHRKTRVHVLRSEQHGHCAKLNSYSQCKRWTVLITQWVFVKSIGPIWKYM